MTISLEELKVRITADIDQFGKQLNAANGKIDAFAGKSGTALSALAARFAQLASGAAALGAAKFFTDYVAEINDAAKSTGIAAEQIQVLRAAATEAGLGVDLLRAGLERLNIIAGEAAADSAGPAAESFRKLGISVTDASGRIKDNYAILQEISAAVRKLGTTQERGAALNDIFGRSAGRWIDLLGGGPEKLDALNTKLRDMNSVLSNETVAAVSKANDELNALFSRNIGRLVVFTAEQLRRVGVIGRSEIEIAQKQLDDAKRLSQAYEFFLGGIHTPGLDADRAKGAARIKELEQRLASLQAPAAQSSGPLAIRITPSQDKIDYFKKLRDEGVRLEAETRTPLEKYQAQLAKIDELLRANAISAETASRAQAAALQEFSSQASESLRASTNGIQAINGETEKLTDTANELGLTFSSAFEDAVIGGQNFSDILQGLSRDIQRIILRESVTNPLGERFSSLFSGGGGALGGIFDSIFGKLPGRAEGGPVSMGRPYIVGEAGPELFVPSMSGAIIPNGAGGGVSVVQNLTFSANTTAEARAVIRESLPGIISATKAAVADSVQRGGSFGRAIRGY